MNSPTFVKRVAELSGVDKEIAERVVRATLLNLGTRIDPGEADDLRRSCRKRSVLVCATNGRRNAFHRGNSCDGLPASFR